ncbi:MAG: RNA polymerase sigma factor [Balneolaceae bacterium]|nr:RNA polymerase sigma factor [Balneolaceae bacterium]
MLESHIQKVLDGEKEAFRFIIRQFQDGAYMLAVSILKEEFAAKDTVQAAFVKTYTRLHTFERKSSFRTWFHRIVVNEAFQLLRSQKRRQKLSFALKADREGISGTVNNIEQKTDDDHLRFYIREAMKELTADEALALQLFYLEEYSIKETGEITGWSESKTKVLLHRARKKLKEILTETYNIKPIESFE